MCQAHGGLGHIITCCAASAQPSSNTCQWKDVSAMLAPRLVHSVERSMMRQPAVSGGPQIVSQPWCHSHATCGEGSSWWLVLTCAAWLDAAYPVSLVEAGHCHRCCLSLAQSELWSCCLGLHSVCCVLALPSTFTHNLLPLSAATLRVRRSQPLLCHCLQP